MGQIFSTAQAVYIWLDDASTQKALVRKFRERCSRWRDEDQNWGKQEYELVAWDFFACEHRPGTTILDQDVFNEIEKISDHDYWQRLWTLQEVFLGARSYVVLDDTIVDIEAIHALRKVAIAQEYGSFPQPEAFQLVPQWSSLNHFLNFLGSSRQYQYPSSKRNWPLGNLLSVSCVRKCSDIRDKVYGLVGMCNGLKGFDIDYRCSVEEVLMRTFVKLKEEEMRPGRANPQTVCKIGLEYLCIALGVDTATLTSFAGLNELEIEVPDGEYEDDLLADYAYIFLLDDRRWVDSGSLKMVGSKRFRQS